MGNGAKIWRLSRAELEEFRAGLLELDSRFTTLGYTELRWAMLIQEDVDRDVLRYIASQSVGAPFPSRHFEAFFNRMINKSNEKGRELVMSDLTPNVYDEINKLHSEILSFGSKTIDNAIRIGEILQAKKTELDHGEWYPWIKNNLIFGVDSAQRYIRVFERRDELPRKEIKTLTQALGLLKKSNDLAVPPDPARKRSVKDPDERRLEAEAAEKEKETLLESLGMPVPVFEDLNTRRNRILNAFIGLVQDCFTWEEPECLAFLKELRGIFAEAIRELEQRANPAREPDLEVGEQVQEYRTPGFCSSGS